MDDDDFVSTDALAHGIDTWLQFRTFYIQPSEPGKLYAFKEKLDDLTLWEDEEGNRAYRKEYESLLTQTDKDEWLAKKNAWTEDVEKFRRKADENVMYFNAKIDMKYSYGYTDRLLADFEEIELRTEQRTDGNVLVYYRDNDFGRWKSAGVYAKVFRQAYDLRVVQNVKGKYLVRTKMFEPLESKEQEYDFAELLDNVILHFVRNDKEYWAYLENNICFAKKPELVTIGFLNFLKMDDV